LKALRRVKDSPIKIKSKDLTQEERHKLENFEVNILIRRGNAYLKLGQLFHAKSDFESVIKLQPNNEAVRETLAKINSEQ
jgi:Tfp pilus assembly protein PilF